MTVGNGNSPEATILELVAEGNFREALRIYDDLASISAVPMPPEIEYAAALASARLGMLNRAASLGASAWSGFHAAFDQHGTMRAANLLGGVAFQQGRMEAAQAFFEEAIERAQSLLDADMAARASNNLASLMHLQDKGALAENLYRSALQVYQQHDDRRGIAQTTHNLALVQGAEGRAEDAYETHDRAVEVAEKQDDAGLLGLTLTGRAEAGLELNNISSAETDLRRARGLLSQVGDEVGLGEVERLEGWLEFKGQRYHSALGHAHRGWDIAARAESPQLLGECASLAAQALRALKRDDQAGAFRDGAIAAFRSLGAATLLRRFESEWAA